MVDVLEKELSYKIMGILFKVHSTLGNRYHEKYYQRAIALELKSNGISFQKEIGVNLIYEGDNIGKYLLDFLIDDKIILEIKAVPKLLPKDFKQILAYLTANNLELGLLVNFSKDSLEFKRILNSKHFKKNL